MTTTRISAARQGDQGSEVQRRRRGRREQQGRRMTNPPYTRFDYSSRCRQHTDAGDRHHSRRQSGRLRATAASCASNVLTRSFRRLSSSPISRSSTRPSHGNSLWASSRISGSRRSVPRSGARKPDARIGHVRICESPGGGATTLGPPGVARVRAVHAFATGRQLLPWSRGPLPDRTVAAPAPRSHATGDGVGAHDAGVEVPAAGIVSPAHTMRTISQECSTTVSSYFPLKMSPSHPERKSLAMRSRNDELVTT